ncbi:type I toxin-antitoxin system Fst family toxin [Enterococcus faecalis]
MKSTFLVIIFLSYRAFSFLCSMYPNLCKEVPLFCVFMFEKLISLVIAPLLVGLVLLLVDRWLDD